MNGLRIAFVTPEYVTENYFSGGLANYVHRIAKSLVSQGHEVYVLTLSDSEQSEFVHYGVRVHRITVTPPSRWLKRITRYRLNRTLKYLDFSTRAFLRLRQLNKQEQLDIVQFPNYQACGLISRFFLRIPQVTRISSYSPIWNEQSKSKRNLDAKTLEWLEWLQLRLSRNIYAPSFTLKKILAQEAKISNVRVIRTPFYQEAVDWDESLYEPCLKEKQYLLFFGRFQLHKGFHILAQAVPYVLEKYPDCHAAFVGLDVATSLAPSMEEYARSLCGDLADRLIFLGQTPHSQLYPIITGAKLVVLPSLVDNLPNACLEAMALGKPVIGTIGASFEELIDDGESGFLVPPNNVDALTRKITEAWMHPKLDMIGQTAEHKILQFSPERTVQEVIIYYRKVLSSNLTIRFRRMTYKTISKN